MRRRAVAITAVLGCGPGIATDESGGTRTTESESDSTSAVTSDVSSGGVRVDLGDIPAGFISSPDGGSVSIGCSVWQQDCPPGEKCMPWANDDGNTWNATRCSPIAPDPGQPGDACIVEINGVSGIDDCDIASMCWGVDPETNAGTCIAFCVGSENAPLCVEPNHRCSTNGEGTLNLCMPTCHPLLQNCRDGEGCWGIDDDYLCAPDASGEMGVFGDPCEYINVCDPGLFCAVATAVADCHAAGCCSSYCALGQPNTCPGDGQECIAAFDPALTPPGYENVGLCAVPS